MRRSVFSVLVAICASAPGIAATERTLDPRALERARARQPHPVALRVVGGEPFDVSAHDIRVTLGEGQFLRSTAPPESIEAEDRSRHVLPLRFTGFTRSSRLLELAPVLEIERKVVRFEADSETYHATVLVGLDDGLSPGEQLELPPACVLQLSADGAQFDRRSVRIRHTGPPYEQLHLSSREPGETIPVTLQFQGEPATVRVGVERPRLLLDGVPRKLHAWGFGKATIQVLLSEEAGGRMRGASVSFTPGIAEPDCVAVSAETPASVRVRTIGLGRSALLTVQTAGFTGAEQRVPVGFPFLFFMAALVGGGIGPLALRLARAPRSRGVLGRHALAGAVVGVMGATLYALGVNMTGIHVLDDDMAVMIVAALISALVVRQASRSSIGVETALEGKRPGA